MSTSSRDGGSTAVSATRSSARRCRSCDASPARAPCALPHPRRHLLTSAPSSVTLSSKRSGRINSPLVPVDPDRRNEGERDQTARELEPLQARDRGRDAVVGGEPIERLLVVIRSEEHTSEL